ncbi:MAG: flagellar biosynthesis anti-sigma factor FlgM [Bdellovibrionaceae bacterium]|nr:flagellar biosynthesis anti-sigma factor FlgM [Pseudobdellovibrionaceae bacterium]MBX3032788.1 flagellar biosynthesis anti-sigma factor FlgM [Pseudobdellovibrionaceae bacterium]
MKITHNKVGQNLNLVDGARADKADGMKSAKDAKLGKLSDQNAIPLNGRADAATVDVSDRAQEAKRIKELANARPDVDMEKVAKFRNLIESGQYKVDARAVADRMVDEAISENRMEAKN